MGFFEKLLSLFSKKKSSDQLFQEKMIGVLKDLNELDKGGVIKSPENSIALKNVCMMMRCASDRFTNYSYEDVNEISNMLHLLIGDVENAGFGIPSTSDIERIALTEATKNYIGLLAYYINANIRTGKKRVDEAEMNNRRAAAISVYNIEALKSKMEEATAEREKEYAKLESKKAESQAILNTIASLLASDPRISRLKTERIEKQAEIQTIDKKIQLMNTTIAKILKQIEQEGIYSSVRKETAALADILTFRSFKNLEELDEAIAKYNEMNIRIETEQTTADESISKVRAFNQKEDIVDDELAEALKKAAENEAKAKTKAQDAANFDFDSEENENGD